jgi:NAD(P)-dependent dehydrogenase (short-subunit alcohol dehydrogenase family)
MTLSRRTAVVGGAALSLAASQGFAADAPVTALITGANRGIGFEFAKQYAERGYRVIATARDPAKATELQDLAKKHKLVSIEKLDVTDLAAIDALAAKLKGTPIDLLVNNAGIGGGGANQNFGKINYAVFDDVMRTNAQGPLKMTEAFMDHVMASKMKKVVLVTSSQGSIASVNRPSLYFYRASKAAVNMALRNVALAVKDKGVMICMVAPGATDTDFMAEVRGRMPLGNPADRTKAMIGLVDKCTMEQTGVPIEWDGTVIPW